MDIADAIMALGATMRRSQWRLYSPGEGVIEMITFDSMIQFGIFVVALISLVYKIAKK